MKRLIQSLVVVLLVASLGWSAYLTQEIKDLKGSGKEKEPGTTEVNKVVSEMETDVTRVVEDIQDKVVSVVNQKMGQTAGSGSGIVYKNEGGKVSIITNHHVIDGAESVYVTLSSGEEVEAKVIGSDQFSDLALLEVEADLDIKPFDLADSSYSKVGEFVIAVGSPMGLEFANSVTFGIISGKDRTVPVDLDGNGTSDWDMVVIQTDAAINPGNSGGALVNMKGELVGINSMKLSSNNIEGMGFAIPINEVIPIVEQLEEHGSVKYPIMGISAVALEDMNIFNRQSYKVSDALESGVFIADVSMNGPAYKAGIKKGDIITKFDGEDIKTFKDFRRQLYKNSVGDEVTLEINRGGKTMEVSVVLE